MTDVQQPASERTLGKYHIVRPLKVGGSAAIYLAIMRGENNFSREVVIKRPLPHLVADRRLRLMFIDEAHIAARLSHPNVCQVLDLVSREDEVYLVLEYLQGVDLREILKRCLQTGRLLPPEVAVWIGIECAAGLDFAHDATGLDGKPLNLVHRDVSPKNIRITHSGSVKLIDFGIARAMNRATETAIGTIKGTLGYMSPEQILGDELDRRSDIFAYGIVLFQMLTLKNPFDGPNLKERVRKLTQTIAPSVRTFNPALDDEIAGIVARCLAPDITARYQTMEDVQRDLERYLARLQVVSPRQNLIEFLESSFPRIHETDPELAEALSEVSAVTGRIDTGQRLRFPDDDEAEETRPPDGPKPPQTAAPTEPPGDAATERPSLGATEPRGTAATVPSDPAALPTAKAAPASGPAVRDAARPLPTAGMSRAAAKGPAPARPRLSSLTVWGLTALALAAGFAGALYASNLADGGPRVESIALDPAGRTEVTEEPAKERTEEAADLATPGPSGSTEPKPTGVESTRAAAVTAAPVTSPKVRSGKTTPGPNPRAKGPELNPRDARLFFRTAVRFERTGRDADAVLLYHLAYAASPRRPDSGLYLNLGLLHNREGRSSKARACLRTFLERRPDGPQAGRVRTLVASFEAGPERPCVGRSELAAAQKQWRRRQTAIQTWLEGTVERALQ